MAAIRTAEAPRETWAHHSGNIRYFAFAWESVISFAWLATLLARREWYPFAFIVWDVHVVHDALLQILHIRSIGRNP